MKRPRDFADREAGYIEEPVSKCQCPQTRLGRPLPKTDMIGTTPVASGGKWVSASAIRWFMMGVPYIDYVEKVMRHSIDHTQMTLERMSMGIEFEKKVMEFLSQKFPPGTIRTVTTDHRQAMTATAAQNTFQAMREGVPILYQGVLHDETRHLFGIPDLLVRSDYINKLADDATGMSREQSTLAAPNLGGNYHYRVVDIKNSCLHLAADDHHLLMGSGSTFLPAWMGQLAVYNMALERTQGFRPPTAYLLGNSWTKRSGGGERCDYCLGRLGEIDFLNKDEPWERKALRGAKWLRDVREEARRPEAERQWTILPPNRHELYVTYNHQVNDDFVDALAVSQRDITCIKYCGPSHRVGALRAGVTQWIDPRLTASSMGFTGSKRPQCVDMHLKFHRGDLGEMRVYPPRIPNPELWAPKDDILDIAVDYESVEVSTLERFPDANRISSIFMIGLAWVDKDGRKRYAGEVVRDLSDKEEHRIFARMTRFVKATTADMGKRGHRLIHWNHTEHSRYTLAHDRDSRDLDPLLNWYDIYQRLFEPTPVLVKGSLTQNLKSVTKAMHAQGLVDTEWPEGVRCTDGEQASYLAYKANAERGDIALRDMPEIKDIKKYNRSDVCALLDIMDYLARHHAQ